MVAKTSLACPSLYSPNARNLPRGRSVLASERAKCQSREGSPSCKSRFAAKTDAPARMRSPSCSALTHHRARPSPQHRQPARTRRSETVRQFGLDGPVPWLLQTWSEPVANVGWVALRVLARIYLVLQHRNRTPAAARYLPAASGPSLPASTWKGLSLTVRHVASH